MVGTRCASTTSFVIGLAIASAAHGSFLDPFEYAGSEGSSLGLIPNEAGNGLGGASVFAGAGFGSNMVNVFLADLSKTTANMNDSGPTLSMMWDGVADGSSESIASASVTNMFDAGEDVSFTMGLAENFAFGQDARIIDGFNLLAGNRNDSGSVDPRTETPQGFMTTTLQAVDQSELMQAFLSLEGSIQEVGLFNYGDHTPQSSSSNPYYVGTTPLIVPLPPPVVLALIGLIGVVWLRRRMT